jgi:uncharacterized protein (TIGR02217 family)
MTSGFHDVRLPVDLSFGATGGPEWRTDIVELASGREVRNTTWSASRRRYDVGLGLRALSDLEDILAFFEARRGPLFGFRMRDWLDWKSCSVDETPDAGDQLLGHGDGTRTVFQLRKVYQSGEQQIWRDITRPVAQSVRVAVGDVELFSGFTIDPGSGEVVFDVPPAEGAAVAAGFEFDVPVRFEGSSIVTSLSRFAAGEVPSIPLVEVRV